MEKVLGFIAGGRAQGARLLLGGTRVTSGELARGYFVAPAIFDNCRDDMDIVRQEIFGPVLSVLEVADEDEAVRVAGDTPYGLAAAVWTSDLGTAHRVSRKLKAGTVWVNCFDVFDAAAPFGGFKQSGIGRELGEYGLQQYSEIKTVTVKL